ncbi:uncharacterized protein A1O9_03967 [Exophiala aquamarina CBS 119918]|uniref:Beta-glucuronidase C-terminal domain-containing protein n=1 Tax=Exophiala aquamarina CBS 119918 TaxID=1182545 RepID=A0A072PIH2_9EURO|nr:uncharacterized protein A1O9_03967 [Exophiala aquamarina CBS 119918]KEF59123.1 hypothetical protein A1O9_03967 [Exophiala aquamarina CBS 119918]
MLISAIVAGGAVLAKPVACVTIPLSLTPPKNTSQPVLESFVSFSIEFSSFPDFAGNSSHPNDFSYNLLKNLGDLQGSNPIIRVGGNTQDYATFNASQSEQLVGTFNFNRSRDYPTTISIGPSYFDSYSTWPNISYIHGFNLGKNGSAGHDTLVGTVPLVCKALASSPDSNNERLAYWQLGNEPDLFKTSSQGPVRPSWWNETDYVQEWLNKTHIIRDLVQKNCPEILPQDKFRFYGPSFAGTGNSLNMITTWKKGIDADQDISFVDSHNYIGGATQPGVTLQGTLMNHSSTAASVKKHLNESRILLSQGVTQPYILGETNSLYNEGAPGLSNSFGAALWGLDFNLHCAANNIRRVHMHQGTNYRYASWQPLETVNETLGTKAPYYGNIAVATFLGNPNTGSGRRREKAENVSVAEIDLAANASIYHSAYAAYLGGRLTRVAVIQMRAYNYSTTAEDSSTPRQRPIETFEFQLDGEQAAAAAVKSAVAERLIANGSDAITGVTFGGYSFNHDLDEGRPVLLKNVSASEPVQIQQGGRFAVDVPWSSAVILSFAY